MKPHWKALLGGYLPCLFAVTVWGGTFTVSKQVLAVMPPLQLLLARFVVAYVALWAVSPRRLRWQGLGTEARLAGMGLLGVTLYFCFENLALLHGSAGMVSVVVCTSPVLTALLPRLVGTRARPLGGGYWLGFALAAVGVLLTVSRGDWGVLRGAWTGAALAATGAVTWAFYTLLAQGLPASLGQLALTRRTFFWGLVTMVPLCAVEWGRWQWASWLPGPALWRVLGLGLVAGAGCYLAWNCSVKRLGSLRTSLFLYLNPVVGVVTAALILGEALTPMVLLGVALTLAGVALSSLSTR